MSAVRPESRNRAEVPQARLRARSMLFDLYGDFAVEGGRGGAIRLTAIARLAPELGVSALAARAAANRMAQDGWLVATRRGRESVYALSERGLQLIEQGRGRIFAAPERPWDGWWYLAALSVPESRREVRDRMRKELSWLGFGSPSAGLYLSPRDHRAAVERLADELAAGEYLQVYRAQALRPAEPHELVRRAWANLGEVNLRYAAFLDRFARELERSRNALEAGTLDAPDAFRARFTLAYQFRKCLFGDPDLPAELLPASWWGSAARRLFLEYHALVTPRALRYFDAVNAIATQAQGAAR